MRTMKLLIAFIFFRGIFDLISAQTTVDWGKEPALAKEKYSFFTDEVRNKNYEKSRETLYWLLNNTPQHSKLLYQKAAEVYENLAKSTKDAKLKTVFQDSLLTVFDLRIKYFNEEANVLNIKGAFALSFWQNRPEKQEELYDLYKKIFELNGEKTASYNINYLMFLACVMKQANKKDLNDEKILEIHEKLSDVIEKRITNDEKYKATWEESQKYIDTQLEGCVKINCENLDKLYTPKFKENPEDTVLLKKMYGVMIKGKCTDDPLFMNVADNLVKKSPTYQRWKTIGVLKRAKGDIKGYIDAMENAFKYGGTVAEKAEVAFFEAQEESKKGNPASAREKALKAASIDPSQANKAYSFIGYLYLNSANLCKGSEPTNPCHAKAVNIAAYRWFEKASDNQGMQVAKSRYPTNEDIHTNNMSGQSVNIGCWINETVTIPTLKY